MNTTDAGRWIRAGLWGLPVAWLVTAWGTLEPQPDQEKDPAAWARFVSSDAYQLSHLLGAFAGTLLALFGIFALGCFLAPGRSGRLALPSMTMAAAGTALLLVPAVISTFATPAIGGAYLKGNQDVMRLEFPASMTGAFLLGLLLAFAGSVLLGIAVWRSRILPRWAGALWVAGAALFYVLGVVLGLRQGAACQRSRPGRCSSRQPAAGLLGAHHMAGLTQRPVGDRGISVYFG